MVYACAATPTTSTTGPNRAPPAGYPDVLPYFKRMEHAKGGEDGWRGTARPAARPARPRAAIRSIRALRRGGRQAGFEPLTDYNGVEAGRLWRDGADDPSRAALVGRQTPISALPSSARMSAWSMASRGSVIIENQRATGVEIEAGQSDSIVEAQREVIVAASAINSPKLLMLSGIGPAAHLRRNGIDVVADRPGVGRNLQDHLELYIQQESPKPITLNSVLNPFSKALIGARVAVLQVGPRRDQPFRGRRLRALGARASIIPTSSTTSSRPPIRYDGKAAPGSATASRRMSARCARSRAARSRSALTDPLGEAGNPLQLHVASGRLERLPPLHPADARNFRAVRLRPLSRPRDVARQRGAERRRARRLHPRACRERLPPLRHLPHGQRDGRRPQWSIRNAA